MKERTSGPSKKNRVPPGRKATLQTRRAISGLGIVLGLTLLLTPLAFSQSQGKSTPQTNTDIAVLKSIDATRIPRNDPPPYPISFEELERYQGRIDIKGDGSTWRAVRFGDLPSQVSVVVAESSTVYPTLRQSISAQQWHPFKTALPIIIMIEKTATLPVEISFELSTVKVPRQGLSPAEAQQYVSNPDNVEKPQVRTVKITFASATPVTSASGTQGTPTPSGSSSVTAEDDLFPSWLKLPPWLIFVVVIMVLLSVLVASSTKIASAIRKIKERRGRKPPQRHAREQKRDARLPTGDIESLREKMTVHRPEPRGIFARIFRRSKTHSQGSKESWGGVDDGNMSTNVKSSPPQVNKPPTDNVSGQPSTTTKVVDAQLSKAREGFTGSPPPSGNAQLLDQETSDRLKKIEEDYEKLQNAHQTFVDRVQEALNSETGLRNEVEIKVNALREELKTYYKDYYKEQSGVLLEDLREKQEKINQIQRSSDNALTNIQSQVKHFEETVKRLKDEAKQRETELNDRHSRILGEVLGLSVETLKEGKFEAIVDEARRRLNQFFSEQPAKADGLSDLHRKAQAINSEMQTTVEKVRRLKPELGKLEPYAERAKELANELWNASSLQGQPRSFKITLDFPAMKFTKAREIFLEDLGKAVQEQIDRLDDPHAFWSKELEVFITSDIVALADICDVEVTGRPGSNPELEQTLSELFRQAGLTTIVPAPGEPFKPGEQHLIEMVSGPPANSQKIKRVVKRGFYYIGNAKEQLIRKAGVDVYR